MNSSKARVSNGGKDFILLSACAVLERRSAELSRSHGAIGTRLSKGAFPWLYLASIIPLDNKLASRRPEAVMQYHRCEEILKRELDLGLSPETVRLYEQIVGERPNL